MERLETGNAQKLLFGCFICQKNCGKETRKEDLVSLKVFLRYLDMKVYQLWSKTSDKLESDGEVVDDNVNLCEGCSIEVHRFWMLYKDWETVRLTMDKSVQSLVNVMRKSEASVTIPRSKSERQRDNDNLIEMRRKETMRKCDLKLQSIPWINLMRIQNIPKQRPGPVLTLAESKIPFDLSNQNNSIDKLEVGGEASYAKEKEDDQKTESKVRPPPPENLQADDIYISEEDNIISGEEKRARFPCSYCSHDTKYELATRTHMMTVHTASVYKDLLPPGTTQAEVRTVLRETIKASFKRKDGLYRCHICRKGFRNFITIHFHLIKSHFDKIADMFKNTSKQQDNSVTVKGRGEVKEPELNRAVTGPYLGVAVNSERLELAEDPSNIDIGPVMFCPIKNEPAVNMLDLDNIGYNYKPRQVRMEF